jgi:hypothetical protein
MDVGKNTIILIVGAFILLAGVLLLRIKPVWDALRTKQGENFWNNELNICQHNTDIIYVQGDHDAVAPEVIKKHTDSVAVKCLYIVPYDGRWTYSTSAISNVINNRLKPALGVSPKVKGKGNFEFMNPVTSADSLWLVQNGWTVNQ